MKILVISGFLGAGKTTFIKMLVERTHKKFVVLENDYAQTDIDSALLRASTDLNIYELTEGCVCCSMKQDFATSILTISNTLNPEYLVVEPTGVAKLSNILANIKRIEYDRITLLKPLTLLDGNSFDNGVKLYGDIFTDQLIAADKIFLTKMEQAYPEEVENLTKKVRTYNSDAEILLSHYSAQPESWWNSLFEDDLESKTIVQTDTLEETNVETLSVTQPYLENPVQLIKILEGVVSGAFGGIIRAKGILPCGQMWLQFDVVNKLYSITGLDIENKEQPRCVFIGKDIEYQTLKKLFQPSQKPVKVHLHSNNAHKSGKNKDSHN